MDSTPKHVLVTDNDPISRRLFGSLLAKAGLEVLYAGSGKECLELARTAQPDLILLDYNMPGMDGMETAESLSKDPQCAKIPICWLTNNDLPSEVLNWAKETGVVEYIHKGVSNEEFVELVKKILEKDKTVTQEPS